MDDEVDIMIYLQESFENSGQFPSENLFLMQFPNLPKTLFYQINTIPVEDFRVFIANFIRKRLNEQAALCIEHLPKYVRLRGISEGVQNQWDELSRIVGRCKIPDIKLRLNSRDNYAERAKSPLGMKTGIKMLDELISGMDAGTVNVIAGYTSHMKTMFAVNVAYLNSYFNGFNIAYFSLETSKETMYDQMLARHSYDQKVPLQNFIPHDKIRKCNLSQDEYDYLYDVIEPDLYEDNADGTKRGKVMFFDLSDFDTFSFAEISNTLEALDDMLGGSLDAVIVDYVQLCKFMDGGANLGDDNRIINAYVAFFRKLAMDFRSGKEKKKLIIILLSQINRDSWKKALRRREDGSEGHYDLTCLADANELERGAARVFTTYTSENMKFMKEAQVQLLKNRHGATLWEPEKIFADSEAYVYSNDFEEFYQSYSGTVSQGSLSAALPVLDDLNNMLGG